MTSAASPPQSSQGGAALNDQGFRLLQRGDAAGALPLLEEAVSKLQGTGSLAEAYASYNLALARYSTGSCDGVKDLLEHSKKIQGDRGSRSRGRQELQGSQDRIKMKPALAAVPSRRQRASRRASLIEFEDRRGLPP